MQQDVQSVIDTSAPATSAQQGTQSINDTPATDSTADTLKQPMLREERHLVVDTSAPTTPGPASASYEHTLGALQALTLRTARQGIQAISGAPAPNPAEDTLQQLVLRGERRLSINVSAPAAAAAPGSISCEHTSAPTDTPDSTADTDSASYVHTSVRKGYAIPTLSGEIDVFNVFRAYE